MIISEGTPMTNGEVFALLRRRRDERNAKLQPPFGMQFLSQSSSTSQTQPQRGSAQAMTNVSANTTLFFPPEAIFIQDQQGGVIGTGSTMSLLNARNNDFFASPTVSHLIVLLTELRALRYLSKYATISGINRVHALYGPTSIHCRARRHTVKPVEEEEEESRLSNDNTNRVDKHGNDVNGTLPELEDGEGTGGASLVRQEEALMQIVQRCRPGTVGHVRAVDAVLSFWEMRGRKHELNSSNRVKALLRTLRDRLQASLGSNKETSEACINGKEEQQLPSFDRPRLVFAPPSVPLSMFLAEQPSPSSVAASVGASLANRDGGAAVGGSAALLQKELKWTSHDLLRLVMARPRDSLDVHRVVDNLEELVGQNEEVLNFMEEEIVRVFA